MPTPVLLVCCVSSVQMLGLMSVALARLTQGSRAERLTQRLFYFFLVSVAATTMLAAGLGSGWWPMCGMTFGVMIVGATLDAGGGSEAPF